MDNNYGSMLIDSFIVLHKVAAENSCTVERWGSVLIGGQEIYFCLSDSVYCNPLFCQADYLRKIADEFLL